MKNNKVGAALYAVSDSIKRRASVRPPKQRPKKKSITLTVESSVGIEKVSYTTKNKVFVQEDETVSAIRQFLDSLLFARANNHNKNIFRSYAGIIQENIRQRNENRYIIHPYSVFRWYWEILIVVMLLVMLTFLPIQVSFMSHEQHSQWMALIVFVDVLCVLDVIFTFRTGYMETKTEKVILDNRQICMHYLKTWFLIDFISSFPFDMVYEEAIGVGSVGSDGQIVDLPRLASLLSLIRILRVTRLLRYMHDLETVMRMEGTVLSIIHLVLLTLIFIHWNACLQYLVSYIQGFPEVSWVAKYGLKADNTTMSTKYSFSMYRSVAHMLGMGYGQHLPPTTLVELWLGITSYILGGTFYALFIAHVSNLIISRNLAGRNYEEKPDHAHHFTRAWSAYSFGVHHSMSSMLRLEYALDGDTDDVEVQLKFTTYLFGRIFFVLYIVYLVTYIQACHSTEEPYKRLVSEVKEYMRFRKIPPDTQKRVMEFYERMYKKKYFDEKSILWKPNMSPRLRDDILLHNCHNLVMKVSFLKEAPHDFLCDIIAKLEFRIYFPNDVIIAEGHRGVAMYFIEHGEVEVRVTDVYVKNLSDGDYFGEISLILDKRTTASVAATEISDVYVLSRSDFDEVLTDYPDMKAVLEQEARSRFRDLKKAEEMAASRQGSLTQLEEQSLEETSSIPKAKSGQTAEKSFEETPLEETSLKQTSTIQGQSGVNLEDKGESGGSSTQQPQLFEHTVLHSPEMSSLEQEAQVNGAQPAGEDVV